ncbi:ATP-binding cassette subfamily B protein [Pseudomonas psychrotolerans]|nr:ATP-binding cassette subfamily B protein [Pseudomonas psychrotolerans]
MKASARRERQRAEWPLPERVGAFLWRYVRLRPWHFGGLLLLVIGAATCAVAVQYGMKLLVDAMADPGHRAQVWSPFWLFISLIVLENLFWRCGGWLGCRTVVASCADMRVDLFRYLTGHPMHYFAQHFAGALGNRVSATGTAAGAIYGGLAWKIMPPCVDFIGAVVVLCTVDLRMAAALVAFVVIVALVITTFGIRGRARHQRFAAQSARVSGELVDLVQNVWTIKAFSAREREVQRFAQAVGVEARAQRRSWMHLEKARVLHDTCLSLMAGGMLAWAIALWTRGGITAGDVVMVSALTFRILHGSRDLALALVDTTQQLGAIGETLRILIQPHAQSDVERPLVQARGALRFEGVHYRYPDGRQVFQGLSLQVPAGQKVGLVGPSGAGKSTLIGLLQRLDDVQLGQIRIDGEDIRSVSQDSLRQRIAVVPQETALFKSQHSRKHPLWPPRGQRCRGGGGRPSCLLRRLHPPATPGLRHPGRRARGAAVRWPAPTPRHRPGLSQGRPHPHPRRGDLGAGQPLRDGHPASAAGADGRAYRLGSGPSTLHPEWLRPHPGAGAGRHRRGWAAATIARG